MFTSNNGNNYEKIYSIKSIKQIFDSQLQIQHFEEERFHEELVKFPGSP